MAPVFFLFVFAIIEFGAAYGDKLGVTNAVTAGTRTASAGGNDGFADYNILQSVGNNADAITRGSVKYLVVFKAANNDSIPSADCRAGIASTTPGAECNVYQIADLAVDRDRFGCKDGEDLDKYWCPLSRKTAQTAANGGPPDYIGVWMKVVHDYYTGFFGSSVTFTDQSIIQIEPRQL